MRELKLPKSELEAADRILGSLVDHGIDVDYFDRAELVRSRCVVTLPELKPQPERVYLIQRAKLFIAGIYASTRAKSEYSNLSEMDMLFLDSPAGSAPTEP